MIFKRNKINPEHQEEEPSQTQILENLGAGVCRICWEEDRNLIRPCACTGSIRLVHEKCMVSWVRTQYKTNKKDVKC